jgi:hypothetical protein
LVSEKLDEAPGSPVLFEILKSVGIIRLLPETPVDLE